MAGRQKVDLQIRSVPVALQRRIREKATSKGMSMSKYKTGTGAAAIRAMRDAIDRV